MSSSLSSNKLTFTNGSIGTGDIIIREEPIVPNVLNYSTSFALESRTGLSTVSSSRVYTDYNRNIYLTGIYNSASVPIYDLNGSSTALSLPSTSGTSDNFLIKYTNNGKAVAYTNIKDSGPFCSTISFSTNYFYWVGNFKSSTSVAIKSLDGNYTTVLTIPGPQSSSVFNTFAIKFDYEGIPQSFICFNGTDNVYCLGSSIYLNYLYLHGYYKSSFSLTNFNSGSSTSVASVPTSTLENGFVIKYNGDLYDSMSIFKVTGSGTSTCRPNSMAFSDDYLFVGGYYSGTVSAYSFSPIYSTISSLSLNPSVSNRMFVVAYDSNSIESYTSLNTDSLCTSLLYLNNYLYIYGTNNASSIGPQKSFGQTSTSISVNTSIGLNTPFVFKYKSNLNLDSLLFIPANTSTISTMAAQGPDSIFLLGQYTSAVSVPLYNFYDGSTALSSIASMSAAPSSNQFILEYDLNGNFKRYSNNGITSSSLSIDNLGSLYNTAVYNNSTVYKSLENIESLTFGPTSFTGTLLVSIDSNGNFNYKNIDTLLKSLSEPVEDNDATNKKYVDGSVDFVKVSGKPISSIDNTTTIIEPDPVVLDEINSILNNCISSSSITDSQGITYIASYCNNSRITINNKDGSLFSFLNTDNDHVFTILCKYKFGKVIGFTILDGCYPSELKVDSSDSVYLGGYSDYCSEQSINLYDIGTGQRNVRGTMEGGSIYFIVKWSSNGLYCDNIFQYSNNNLKDRTGFIPINNFIISGSTMYQTISNSINNINNSSSSSFNYGPYSTSLLTNANFPSQYLSGTGGSTDPRQGRSVSIYKDTLAIGGILDNGNIGATWIFVKQTNGQWVQQGSKLVGTGTSGASSYQGNAVCLYEDTVASGSYLDNSGAGATWVFQRVGTVWSQVGSKLVPSDLVSTPTQARFGSYVSIYKDTMAIGATGDNSGRGAVWLYRKNTAGVWAQARSKITSPSAMTSGNFSAVSLGEGRMAIGEVGNSSNPKGKTFIYNINGTNVSVAFTSSSISTTSSASEGNSVSVSDDGNYVVSGAPNDNSGVGCVIVYHKDSTGQWSQQGPKLVGSGYTGQSLQGNVVCISNDASYLASHGQGDNSNMGAVWIFTRSGTVWTQYGSKIQGISSYDFFSNRLFVYKNSLIVGFPTSSNFIGGGVVYDINPSGVIRYNKGIVNGLVPLFTKCTSVQISKQNELYSSVYSNDPLLQLYNVDGSLTPYMVSETSAGTSILKWSSNGLYNSNSFIKNAYGSKLLLDSQNNLYCSGTYRSNEMVPVYDLLPYTSINTGQSSVKLIGTGGTGTSQQGYSVSLSSDGNILAVGGYSDNTNVGAVWIFTRSGTVWTQQGSKLVGTGGTGTSQQGRSVSLSSDGSTLAVGGYTDNTNVGATWIYTRSGTTWTQQGSKLVGTGGTGTSQQGYSVSLSSDGNILAVGGYTDNTNVGAVWIFTRSGTVWTQQGSKLVGTGNTGSSRQGSSISLSSDGSTLTVGGYTDNSSVGATWIFTRSGTVWSQQGSKLVGTGGTGQQNQGWSTSLSSDGSTLAIGGYTDNSSVGATWIYTRSGTVWTQYGSKLIGSGGTGTQWQGLSVSLSSNGSILAVGGGSDNSDVGAAWIYTRSGTTWTQYKSKLIGTGGTGQQRQGISVSLSSDGSVLAVGGYFDNSQVGATWVYYPIYTYSQQMSLYLPGSYILSQTYNQKGSKLVGTGYTTSGIGSVYQGTSVCISKDSSFAACGGITDNGVGATWIFTKDINDQWTQQGSKLVGAGGTGSQSQGQSVYLSSNGSILAVGGSSDNSEVGAVWIFTRSGTVWTQQGSKLVGTGNTGGSFQGNSVSLSSDGSTLAVGGPYDNSYNGAVWIFTRSGTVWTQQGSKLVGTGGTGTQYQGQSVSLSSDGSILAVGGSGDNSNSGAVWIFTRSGTVWTQQGSKLIGMGNTGSSQQGRSVSLTSDGSTLAVGGSFDNSSTGAVWIFTRSGTVWTQQGSKLVGTGGTSTQFQGISTVLSENGKILCVGGYYDNSQVGAIWVFTRSGTVWTQQGSKLVGTGGTGQQYQGQSISTDSDGSTIIVGGSLDNTNIGASWIYDCRIYSTFTFVSKWSPSGIAESVLVVPSSVKNSTSIDKFDNLYLNNVHCSSLNNDIQNFRNTSTESYSDYILEGNSNNNTWITTGSMTVQRQNHCINLLNNGKVLVSCGQTTNTSSAITSSSEIYDPETGTWSNAGNLSIARHSAASVNLNDGRVLVAGGRNTVGPASLTNCDIYDPLTGIWTTTGNMLFTRSSFSLTCLRNNLVLATGGATNTPTSTSELYNPFSGIWTTTGSTIVSHAMPITSLLPNGNVLLVSGSNTPVCEIYNVQSGTWSLTDSLPNSTYLNQYTLLQDSFLVYGGIGGSSRGMFSYDYCRGVWITSLTAPNSGSIYSGNASMLPSGKVLLYGGYTGGTTSSSTFLYEPIQNTWSTVSSMSVGRVNFKSVLLNNGKVLVTGGVTGTTVSTASCELYCPDDYTLSLIKYNSSGIVTGLTNVHNTFVGDNIYNNTVSFDNDSINLVSNFGSTNNFYNYNQTIGSLLTINPITQQSIIPVSTNYTKWYNDGTLNQEPFRKIFVVDNKTINKNTINNTKNYKYLNL